MKSRDPSKTSVLSSATVQKWVLFFLLQAPGVGAAVFHEIGFLPSGLASELRGVSADGQVAVGEASNESGADHLIVWTRDEGLIDLGIPDGFAFTRGRACGIDSTGRLYVAGYGLYETSQQNRALLWAGELDGTGGRVTLLPTFGGVQSIARDLRVMSDDDVRIVGFATNAAGKKQAFRWRLSDGDMLNLDEWLRTDDENGLSDAWGISRGGGKIGGFAQSGGDWAFHFTAANKQGMWNFAPGRGRGISADGNQEELEETYGIDLTDWELTIAWDISDDGMTIVGVGLHHDVPEGWVVQLKGAVQAFRRGDVNVDTAVDIADAISLLGSLFGGRPIPVCPDSADANDDGALDIADAIRIPGHLFGAAGPLPEPFGACGPDSS